MTDARESVDGAPRRGEAAGEERIGLLWQPGEIVDDRYEVREVVQSGGMGLVYRVHHREWNVEFAVKTPRPQFVATEAQLRDFEAEAEAWVRLGLHPHAVSCAYVRRLGGVPRVFAEWIDGGSLSEWVGDRRLYSGGSRAALARILDVAIQFAWGLDHAHAQQLIHQDVKPSNVMLTRDGVAKVTDFGLARARAAAGATALPGKSLRASYRGMTREYCSPEQAAAEVMATDQRAQLTRATDIWSWALSVLELFMGHRPCDFGQAGAAAFAAYVAAGPGDPQIPPMPADVGVVLGHCLAIDPAARPATMGELAQALIGVHEDTFGTPYPRARPQMASLLADGLSNHALSLLDLGRVDRAEALWERAIDADPRNPHVVYNRCLHRWRHGRITDRQVVEALEAVPPGDGSDWTARYLLGRVHLERGDRQAALDVLGDAARVAGADPDVDDALELARRDMASTGSQALAQQGQEVTAVALRADGRLALTGGKDAVARVCDLREERVVCELAGHTGSVTSVALSRDGRVAATGDHTGVLRVWDVRAAFCLGTLQGHDGHVASTALSADGRVLVSTALGDRTVRVWDVRTRQAIRAIVAHAGRVSSVGVSADGRVALSGGEDGALRVWDAITGGCLRDIEAHAGGVGSVAVRADGQVVLTGGADATGKLWELASARCVLTLEGHTDAVRAVALSADGRIALTGSDGSARVWDAHAGRCMRTLLGHTHAVRSVTLSADGAVGLTSGDHRTARAWDLRLTDRAPWSYTRPRATSDLAHEADTVRERVARAARLIDDGNGAAAMGELRSARRIPGYERSRELLDLWRKAARHGRRSGLRDCWHLHDLAVNRPTASVALSADGLLALTGHGDGAVRIYEHATGRVLRVLEGHRKWVRSLSVAPDGRVAASSSLDRTVRVWDLASGRCLRELRRARDLIRSDPATSGAPTPDGRWALAAGEKGAVTLRNLATGRTLHVLEGHSGPVHAVALSADGRTGLSGGVDGTVRAWDLGAQRCAAALKGHQGTVWSVAMSADGEIAVSGGEDRAIRVWDLRTARCVRTLVGHNASVDCVSLSADSRMLISLGRDGTVRVWGLDWDYDFPAPEDFDERARPYLELFLATNALFEHESTPGPEQLELLLAMLERVGLGWLRAEGVRAELDRMRAS